MKSMVQQQNRRSIKTIGFTHSNHGCVCVCVRNEGLIGKRSLL